LFSHVQVFNAWVGVLFQVTQQRGLAALVPAPGADVALGVLSGSMIPKAWLEEGRLMVRRTRVSYHALAAQLPLD